MIADEEEMDWAMSDRVGDEAFVEKARARLPMRRRADTAVIFMLVLVL